MRCLIVCMRVWDINPGYLNRQSLLAEHRELHGIISIIVHCKKGYSRHPETMRWVGHVDALRQRHGLLACEMALRGFTDRTSVTAPSDEGICVWPHTYIDEPGRQFQLLKLKYAQKEGGRIPLPKNAQELWRHHKYSVLARNPNVYKDIGSEIAEMKRDFSELALQLTEMLRTRSNEGGIRNAVQHMWGYVSETPTRDGEDVNAWSLRRLLQETQKRAMATGTGNSYLRSSTALSELMAWLPAE